MNQAANDMEADSVQRRLDGVCQRFLSRSLPALPALPMHVGRELGRMHVAPRVWETPHTEFGHAALWLGRAVRDLVGEDAERVLGAGTTKPSTHFALS